MKFNRDLAAIHAYLCADGYVIKNPKTQKHKYYVIGLRNTNLVLLKDFQNRFKRIFGISPRLIEEQRCVIGSKEIYKKLVDRFDSFYSREWKVPKLNNNLIVIWLRAFFDCEGWVICKTHQNRHIGLDSVNETGLNQVKVTLKRLRIASQIKKRNDRDIFSLKIYGKENLIKFKEEIGFLHPSKKEKLNKVVSDFVEYCWNFPRQKERLKRFVIDIMKKKAKIKKDNGIIRLISNKEKNLTRLQKELNRLFNMESKVNKRKNGIETVYFELNINKHSEVKKTVENNLINSEEREKWLSLRK